VRAGLDEVDGPGFVVVGGGFHGAAFEIEGEASVQHVEIAEVALDHLPLVAQGNAELVEAVVAEVLHDVPENGPLADGQHGLGADLGLLGEAGAETAGENDDLHEASRSGSEATGYLARGTRHA